MPRNDTPRRDETRDETDTPTPTRKPTWGGGDVCSTPDTPDGTDGVRTAPRTAPLDETPDETDTEEGADRLTRDELYGGVEGGQLAGEKSADPRRIVNRVRRLKGE